MRYAVIVINLDRLPPVSTAVNVKSNATTYDPDVRHLLRQGGVALIAGRYSMSLRLGVDGHGDRAGTVDVGDMAPHALLDRVAEALHPDDTIKHDLRGREPRPGEDWTNYTSCMNPRTPKGPCTFCAREIRPGQGFCITYQGQRAHYTCAPGLGVAVRGN